MKSPRDLTTNGGLPSVSTTLAQPNPPAVAPDLRGAAYLDVLRLFHRALKPRRYLEIGSLRGESLTLAECPTISIDPKFAISGNVIGTKTQCHFYQMSSDRFFADFDPKAILGGPLDMAFLDGMHLCEFLLRDFANTEKACKRNGMIMLHDCVPVESAIATRTFTQKTINPIHHNWWTGDIWRTLLLLIRRRPDLRITVLDAQPTGLACITNLDPNSTFIDDNYADLVAEMLSWSLETMGVPALLEALRVTSTSEIDSAEKLSRRFWL